MEALNTPRRLWSAEDCSLLALRSTFQIAEDEHCELAMHAQQGDDHACLPVSGRPCRACTV